MSNATQDSLKRVRELLADPECWTQGRSSRATTNRKKPFAYCLYGAIVAVAPFQSQALTHRLAMHLPDGYGNLVTFNDAKGRKHSEVIAVLDEAIADFD